MKTLTQRRVARILEKVPLGPVLERYGYGVVGSVEHEQQFGCDLHGGYDTHPSARFYPSTKSTYCWGCHKSRNVIDYVSQKEHITFLEALSRLERDNRLEPIEEETPEENPLSWVDTPQDTSPWESISAKAQRVLQSITDERVSEMMTVLGFWEKYDRACYEHSMGEEGPALDRMRQVLQDVRSWMGYEPPGSKIPS